MHLSSHGAHISMAFELDLRANFCAASTVPLTGLENVAASRGASIPGNLRLVTTALGQHRL
jgi:hypothetical protein